MDVVFDEIFGIVVKTFIVGLKIASLKHFIVSSVSLLILMGIVLIVVRVKK